MGILILSLLVKLYGLVDMLDQNIRITSQLNRNAVLIRLLFMQDININNYYVSHDNLYIKKPDDKAVELIPGVKEFSVTQQENKRDFKIILCSKERWYEAQRIYFNNCIDLYFTTELNHAV